MCWGEWKSGLASVGAKEGSCTGIQAHGGSTEASFRAPCVGCAYLGGHHGVDFGLDHIAHKELCSTAAATLVVQLQGDPAAQVEAAWRRLPAKLIR